jgi:hypothetical protein
VEDFLLLFLLRFFFLSDRLCTLALISILQFGLGLSKSLVKGW